MTKYFSQNPNGQDTMDNSQPVVIASDQTSLPVAATLSAETTKVIGVTRTADGSGNLINSIADGASVRGLAVAQSQELLKMSTISKPSQYC